MGLTSALNTSLNGLSLNESAIDPASKLETGTLLRGLTRGGQALPPTIWLDGISKFENVAFEYTPAEWTFGDLSRDWTLTGGKIEVTVTQTVEAELDTGNTSTITAHLRPDMTRPVIQPSP